ncbi:uncharacterized protein [Fopius arisanus]|uniref:Mab-21-like HhH/H2TH-like domain-containing protein n=1 Tax=Fopius arisanus TaxID=64838 RepID=A0A9R1TE18_9HYME|nr:PREDICTED: uncharacterized protein LOC105269262 [Fopius arisanus]XP_011307670.1 PREDICTED: uncharacterized protein LOC105269262 [Fopius arisanus]
MGCTASAAPCKTGGARLMTTKIHFSKEQLEGLNGFFRRSVERQGVTSDIDEIESTIERLVQRLIAGVSNLDGRFSSMFLVSLNERRRIKELKFEYLLRIDTLSTPPLDPDMASAVYLEEDSTLPGFARLGLRGGDIEHWAEFLGPDGRLRRDLVKAKLLNLLAAATQQDSMDGADERICQCPGQVIDAETLDKILKQPDHCRIFYGSATPEKAPEPRDHRVALVEDSSGILLRIGLRGHKISEVEVRLLIGIGVSTWSIHADYPRRVPLHHCDALLHYNAAQSGMYAVAVGPYPGARCEDRSTLWRIRVPATETIMNQHYSEESVPALTESMLMYILDQLRGRAPLNIPMKLKRTLKVVTRHVIKTIHWWSLERAGPDPLASWSPDTLARHVLLVLDELVMALRCQSLRCYFHPRCNVMLQCAKDGLLHPDEWYVSDARLLEAYILALHQYSLNLTPSEPRPSDVLENELIARWRRVMASLPRGTMERPSGYNPRQLAYLGLVLREVLRLRKLSVHNNLNHCNYFNYIPQHDIQSDSTENLIYLLILVLKQARDQIYAITDRKKRKNYGGRRHNESSSPSNFEHSMDILIDIVRRDRDTAYMDLDSDVVLARVLLRWLYFGMEHERKTLGPILRPYLGNLFNSSHENAWHVESWRKRRDIFSSEMRSLGIFCKLVTSQEVSPANGIVESLSKGWYWAERTTKMIERSEDGLKLVFMPTAKILKYSLTFANNQGLSAYSSWSKARSVGNAARRTAMARINMMTSGERFGELTDVNDEKIEGFARHIKLRDSSPLTHVVSMHRRRGRQRGPGGLVPALVSLNKFRILQEAAAVLPREERLAMLDAVQRVSREASRRLRRTSCPDLTAPGILRQTYTPRSESYLMDPPSTAPCPRHHSIITEHQRQLQKEILEMHDSLSRGLCPRTSTSPWETNSVLSWTSSLRSIGRSRIRRSRPTIWNRTRTSMMWDSVGSNGNSTKCKSEEMISREESPKWSNSDGRISRSEIGGDDEILPSWEFLEATLNQKLLHYNKSDDNHELNSRNSRQNQ